MPRAQSLIGRDDSDAGSSSSGGSGGLGSLLGQNNTSVTTEGVGGSSRVISNETFHLDVPFQQIVSNAQAILEIDNNDSEQEASVSPEDLSDTSSLDALPTSSSSDNGDSAENSTSSGAWLSATERLGLIHAGGPPQLIDRLDIYLSSISRKSATQIHSDLIIIDAAWSDTYSQGVDWDLLVDGNDGAASIGSTTSDAAAFAAGGLAANAALKFGDVLFSAAIDLLNETGSRYVTDRTRATTVNGGTAYVGTGDEFSFVSQINAVSDINGIVTTTASVQRMQVGIRFQVTQRLLNNGSVLVEGTPVISALTGFTALQGGDDQSFETPDVALKDLSFQVIARPGVPVYLGGITSTRVLNELNSIPLESSNPLKSLLGTAKQEDQKREIALFLTVTRVES